MVTEKSGETAPADVELPTPMGATTKRLNIKSTVRDRTPHFARFMKTPNRSVKIPLCLAVRYSCPSRCGTTSSPDHNN